MYSEAQKNEAKVLYLKGSIVPEIADELKIPKRTIYDWIKKENWGTLLGIGSTSYYMHQRLTYLLNLPVEQERSPAQLAEIKALTKGVVDLEDAKTRRYKAENPIPKESREKKKRKTKHNDFSHLTEEDILEFLRKDLDEYQLKLWDQRHNDSRYILKSRQIGLTYYFAKEALAEALLTGENQIFISASKAQVGVFRRYIRNFAREQWDIEVKGTDVIELKTPNGTCELVFCSTNSNTAQSYNGNLYIDEQFWINNYEKLESVASAMATLDKYRWTYFSTPSTKSHQAYPKWSGKEYADNCKEHNLPVEEWPSDIELEHGTVCPDGAYRRIITLDTAIKEGCTRINKDKLMMKYTKDKFEQLFCCKFIDDTKSVFSIKKLLKCAIDVSVWKDVNIDDNHPYLGEVWIGYDPSRTRDDACIIVAIPPKRKGGKFRIIEKIVLRNCKWRYQAGIIRELTEKYNVTQITIDMTGPGSGVFEMVQEFFPTARGVYFTPENKTRLVIKAEDIIDEGRCQWSVEWTDITAAFLQIRKTTTGKNGNITYVADRSEATGHGDAAWATMLVFSNEGLTEDGDQDKYAGSEFSCSA